MSGNVVFDESTARTPLSIRPRPLRHRRGVQHPRPNRHHRPRQGDVAFGRRILRLNMMESACASPVRWTPKTDYERLSRFRSNAHERRPATRASPSRGGWVPVLLVNRRADRHARPADAPTSCEIAGRTQDRGTTIILVAPCGRVGLTDRRDSAGSRPHHERWPADKQPGCRFNRWACRKAAVMMSPPKCLIEARHIVSLRGRRT